jgi:TRAP-type C4-dicarboxylate transport system permease small subunit
MRRVYDGLIKLFEWILFALFALLVIVVFMNVFSRFALENSLPWAEELSRFLFVWITFIGAVLVNKKFEHMRLDLLITTLPKTMSDVFEVLISLLAAVVLYILLRGGYTMMIENLDFVSPALEIPYGFINAIVPVCSLIMFFQTIARCCTLLKEVLKGRRQT